MKSTLLRKTLLRANANGTISVASVLLVVLSSASFSVHTSHFDLKFNQQITPAELAEIVNQEKER